ncbi:hypothetical protein [Mycobacterium sp. 236(2023)]|uniref:hypothetical protein n=1 Tax=Mycobacterium sp. 236(2023) TaxID=3038163 RepID=UPI002414F299|nr:hypothetical protein [Mycobacterium sp. 236(2023)]MDG4663428.1 hypothetical protein [Mycobacterium sp. 236(2023)]
MKRWALLLGLALVLAGCSSGEEPPPVVKPVAALDGSYIVEYDGTGTTNGAPVLGQSSGKAGWVFQTACDEDSCVAAGGMIADPENPGAPLKDARVADYVDGRWVMIHRSENVVTCTGPNGEELRADGWSIWDIAIAPDMSLRPTITTVGVGDCPSVNVVTPVMTRVADRLPEFPVPDPTQQPPRTVAAATGFHGSYTSTRTRRGQDAEPEVADRNVRTYCLRTGDRCATTATTPGEPGAEFAHLSVFTFGDGKFVRSTIPLPSPCADGVPGAATEAQTLNLPAGTENPFPEVRGAVVKNFTAGCAGAEEYDVVYALRPA